MLYRKNTTSINLKLKIMGSIRTFMAAMLVCLTFAAFQSDADAQTRRNESRTTTRTSRQAGSSSSVKKSDNNRGTSGARPSSASKPSVQRPSSTSRPSMQQPTRPSSSKPTVQKPSEPKKPAVQQPTRPSSTTRPSSASKPSSAAKPSVTTRPSDQKPSSPQKPNVQKPAGNDRMQVTRPGRSADRPSDRSSMKKPSNGPSMKPSNGQAPRPVHRPNHAPKPRVHPHDRDFMRWDAPSRFWASHNHCFGHRVRVLPRYVHRHVYWGVTYYCYNDIWYRPYGSYYVVCRPPFGVSLAAELIADMTWVAVNMAYYNTVAQTYDQINENNQYIAEQNVQIAQNNAVIAAQNETIAKNQQLAQTTSSLANQLGLIQSYAAASTDYFYQDGVFYVKEKNGEYKVILPPAGALVENLPEDYVMVTLNDGKEYYKVDDTIYKVSLIDGKPYFEVLGQQY